jgi:hypothetical protein
LIADGRSGVIAEVTRYILECYKAKSTIYKASCKIYCALVEFVRVWPGIIGEKMGFNGAHPVRIGAMIDKCSKLIKGSNNRCLTPG